MSASICNLLRHNLRCSPSALATFRLANFQQRRFLDLQEYQSKQILHERGIQVQRFRVVANEIQVKQALYPELYDKLPFTKWSGFADDISSVDEFVIKAQVLAGGRGKGYFKNCGLAGGVKLTKDRDEANHYAVSMLNDHLVTKQTTQNGVLVERVMIAEAVTLKREYYFAIVLDRSYDSGPIIVTSVHGGMDIEEAAAKDENAIRKFTLPIDLELDLDTARKIAVTAYDFSVRDMDLINQCAQQMMKLYSAFLELDATQIEINPLGVTNKRDVICVDAKINFDENARYRHKWLDELETMNLSETDLRDYEARKQNLNFISLSGTIGCLVNGAGLAMATMDIIKLHGGEPANFLDVGGGATANQVAEAFRIISKDPRVDVILVNIFGGIMRCDIIAEGIVKAAETLNLTTPIVCRLQGTRVQDAHEIIKKSDVNIIVRDDLDEAAKQAVKLSRV